MAKAKSKTAKLSKQIKGSGIAKSTKKVNKKQIKHQNQKLIEQLDQDLDSIRNDLGKEVTKSDSKATLSKLKELKKKDEQTLEDEKALKQLLDKDLSAQLQQMSKMNL